MVQTKYGLTAAPRLTCAVDTPVLAHMSPVGQGDAVSSIETT